MALLSLGLVAFGTLPAMATGTTVDVGTNATYGSILTDAQGFALYTSSSDNGGMSSCTGPCASVWPALTVAVGATPTAGPGVTGTVAAALQANGTDQVTYDGSPLYTFIGDSSPGQVTGNGDGPFSVVQLGTSLSPQAINFTSTVPSDATVGGPTYTVTANGGGSGNAVTFAISASASSVCSMAGAVVSFVGAGTCTIDANQLGSSSYRPAPQVEQSFPVTEPCPGGFAITTASLPDGTVKAPYSASLAGCGGTGSYAFKKVGKLPSGLKMTKTGRISGRPKAAGQFSFSVKMTDHAKPKNSVVVMFSITVN